MKIRIMIALLATAILTGCTSGDKKAAELLDTAGFEEKQNNLEHATKLYDEILKKYPESQAAKEAATRLAVLKNQKP
jgi:outer membrane protein assembly factor BamD (BamD/ComL family)